jgi:tripartite-type tricarboxylate transporter receptor subunit TctC
MKFLKLAALCVLLLFASTGQAFAASSVDAYPERPIKIVIPYRAGGQSDLTARKLAEISEKYKLLPQPLVVVTMAGANTRTALRFVQEAAPDGYTLLLHHSTFLAMHSVGQIPMSFRDYEMVGQAVRMPMCAFISLPDSPYKNWSELIEYAKKNNQVINVAISGVGGTTHAMFAYITSATGTAHLFKPIFFSGQTEAKTALLGKKVDVYGDAPVGGIGFVRSGGGKLLLMTDNERREEFPDTTNFEDLGIEDIVYMRNGLYAPKGTPRPILDKLQTMMQKAIATPEFEEYADYQKCYAEFLPGAEYYAQFEKDEKIFAQLAEILKKSIEEQSAGKAN